MPQKTRRMLLEMPTDSLALACNPSRWAPVITFDWAHRAITTEHVAISETAVPAWIANGHGRRYILPANVHAIALTRGVNDTPIQDLCERIQAGYKPGFSYQGQVRWTDDAAAALELLDEAMSSVPTLLDGTGYWDAADWLQQTDSEWLATTPAQTIVDQARAESVVIDLDNVREYIASRTEP